MFRKHRENEWIDIGIRDLAICVQIKVRIKTLIRPQKSKN